ncbi:uncharacterized protein I303_105225 [Kwoniella dejecticola CBS 10117]|uniref:Nucleolar protein 6 n=1 Tax=Kwoniella dejecticola CBS 10117 TaxID=1296121 RepID=A0A1A6A341_9TREE|nr:nucleolar protein 6 [Kwoniella dejecticola CBS 10117]OBR84470.1 nucleolar protein 6 [Kwoniella dejecticola CBS 10117]
MSTNLTKKQQKLAAFRNKQKAKKAGANDIDQPDLPEQDLLDDNEEVPDEDAAVAVKSSEKSSKKEKEKSKAKDQEDEVAPPQAEGSTDSAKPVDKGKKRKTAWDEEEEGADKKKTKKDVKQRFILFVGNLSFKTTKEEVQEHFKEALGQLPSVRLLTTKPTPQNPKTKSRGIAFLELPNSSLMQAALKLHHSNLKGRTINVELTAGGGGNSEDRKRKLAERNERVGVQREKRAEREKEEGGEQDDNVAGQGEDAGEQKEGKTRVRGGRRVKSKSKTSDDSTPSTKQPRYDPSDPNAPLSGWASRQAGTVSAAPSRSFNSARPPRGNNAGGRPQGGGGNGGNPKFQKKKWTPTGANAQPVS